MAFVHGKNTRVYIDQYDMSRYFNEATMAGKVEMADTTTFAAVAGQAVSKTVLPGVKDGTLSFKGLFDSTPVGGPDNYLQYIIANETGVGTVLTPSNLESCVSVAPEGSWAAGKRVWAAANVVSQYQIQSPVKNAVMIQADYQCDGGVNTGVSLHDPSVSDSIPATVLATAAQVLPVATLNCAASTAGYLASGTILVPVSGGFATVAYTGRSASTFTGCTGGTGTTLASPVLQNIPGTGVNDQGLPLGSATSATFTGAQAISATVPFTFPLTSNPITAGFPAAEQFLVPTAGNPILVTYTGITTTSFTGCLGATAGTSTTGGTVTEPPTVSIMGAYAFLHYTSVTGGVLTAAKLQSSEDNTVWVDVPLGAWTLAVFGGGQFGTGQFGGGAGSTGGYILFIPGGTAIQRFVRVVLAYGTASTASSILVTFVRL